jgi:hypothetical protein
VLAANVSVTATLAIRELVASVYDMNHQWISAAHRPRRDRDDTSTTLNRDVPRSVFLVPSSCSAFHSWFSVHRSRFTVRGQGSGFTVPRSRFRVRGLPFGGSPFGFPEPGTVNDER